MTSLVSGMASLYGGPTLGKETVVEPGCVLGRPEESRLQRALSDQSEFNSLYDSASDGCTVGDRCIVRSGAVIYSSCRIGSNVEVGHHAVVREGTVVEDFVRIWPHTSIRSSVRIGQGSRVGGIVGDRSVIEPYVTCLGMLVHEYTIGVGGEREPAPVLRTGSIVSRGAVVVGDVEVGDFAVVGAGAVVRKSVPARVIVGGDPARVLADRDPADIRRIEERIEKGRQL